MMDSVRGRQLGWLLAWLLLLSLTWTAPSLGGYTPYNRAVMIDDVKALTLRRGEYTASRRTAPVPQLKCLQGCEYEPDVVQCTNVGSDGRNAQWRCEADLPSHLRFSSTTGYDSPDDARILEGSCGLEYSLKRVGAPRADYQSSKSGSQVKSDKGDSETSSGTTWFLYVVLAAIAYGMWKSCIQGTPSVRRSTDRPPDYRPTAPPPPYDEGGFGPGGGGAFPGSGFGGGFNNNYRSASSRPMDAGLGWGGILGGLGLGYLLGRPRGMMERPGYAQTQQHYRATDTARSRSWFGWGNTGTGARAETRSHTTTRADEPSTSEMRTATAFASTRRR
eukprot:jgi/Chlat1/1077/Chrsp110S01570